jgi:hypothetical protein
MLLLRGLWDEQRIETAIRSVQRPPGAIHMFQDSVGKVFILTAPPRTVELPSWVGQPNATIHRGPSWVAWGELLFADMKRTVTRGSAGMSGTATSVFSRVVMSGSGESRGGVGQHSCVNWCTGGRRGGSGTRLGKPDAQKHRRDGWP